MKSVIKRILRTNFSLIYKFFFDPVEFYRRRGAEIGKDCIFVEKPNFASEPYLIKIGAKTTLSFGVSLITHDAATRVIRNLPSGDKDTVIYGTIQIGNNCFIGARTTILPNVKIGDNVIIGACSLVNRDIPSNTVAAGNPCKVICSVDEYIEKHKDDFLYVVSKPYEERREYLMRYFSLVK